MNFKKLNPLLWVLLSIMFSPVSLFAAAPNKCFLDLFGVQAEQAEEAVWQSKLHGPKEFEKIFGLRHLTSNEMTDSHRGTVSSYLSQLMYSPAGTHQIVDDMFDQLAENPTQLRAYRESVMAKFREKGVFPLPELSWLDFLALYIPHIHGAHSLSPGLSDPMVSPSVSIRKINESVGYGVFANEDIKAGTWIGEYTGVVSQVSDDPAISKYDAGYAVESLALRAKDAGNFTRFVNHSEAENVELQGIVYKRRLFIGMVANRNIKKGKQILFDYGPGYS